MQCLNNVASSVKLSEGGKGTDCLAKDNFLIEFGAPYGGGRISVSVYRTDWGDNGAVYRGEYLAIGFSETRNDRFEEIFWEKATPAQKQLAAFCALHIAIEHWYSIAHEKGRYEPTDKDKAELFRLCSLINI